MVHFTPVDPCFPGPLRGSFSSSIVLNNDMQWQTNFLFLKNQLFCHWHCICSICGTHSSKYYLEHRTDMVFNTGNFDLQRWNSCLMGSNGTFSSCNYILLFAALKLLFNGKQWDLLRCMMIPDFVYASIHLLSKVTCFQRCKLGLAALQGLFIGMEWELQRCRCAAAALQQQLQFRYNSVAAAAASAAAAALQ